METRAGAQAFPLVLVEAAENLTGEQTELLLHNLRSLRAYLLSAVLGYPRPGYARSPSGEDRIVRMPAHRVVPIAATHPHATPYGELWCLPILGD